MLVVDAAAAVTACLSEAGLAGHADQRLVAPPLLWSEATSVVHELRQREEISGRLAEIALARLLAAPIASRPLKDCTSRPGGWRISLGGRKTYDAEYLPLAWLLRCRLMTTDA